jgi:hypothetical protein
MSLISWFFRTYKEVSQKQELKAQEPSTKKDKVNSYFQFLGAIQDWQSKRQYGKMLECCAKSIPLLPDLVVDCKRQYGKFDISSIPAIEVGCRYWAALNDTKSLMSVHDVIKSTPELFDGWYDLVSAAFEDDRLAMLIQNYIRDHPGTLQNKLSKLLNVSGRDTSRIINTLVNLDKIQRIKSGNSYELHLTI